MSLALGRSSLALVFRHLFMVFLTRVLLHGLQNSLGEEGLLVLSVPKAYMTNLFCNLSPGETLSNWHVAVIH